MAGGAAVLNQVYERDTDAFDAPDATAPAAGQRVSPADAAASGLAPVARRPRAARGARQLAVVLSRARDPRHLPRRYTPMKRRTSLSTLVGAFPGALPPLIGCTAARGHIDLGGARRCSLSCFCGNSTLLAIACLYREDYGKGRLPDAGGDRSEGGGRAARRVVLRCAGAGQPRADIRRNAGDVYFGAALVLGRHAADSGGAFAAVPRDSAARALFFGSITYLPLIWIVMIADRL